LRLPQLPGKVRGLQKSGASRHQEERASFRPSAGTGKAVAILKNHQFNLGVTL
jgi:hypothetical protein